MKTVTAFVAAILAVATLAILFAVLLAYPTMWAVNYLFTSSLLLAIFGTSKIGLTQAIVLNFIFSLLSRGTTSSSKK